ncbi:hypothetical protein JKF63_04514 [Porcisia hertigi]|uniref:Ubiquitin carboxyl-terminal hydrolase n=1 Tax=Porcisia hertigi TaxID=2761500 RepID=A0A836LAC5_9TRYP|nr:hypothetical protein JKF63_04514 [Porcisia hertigi]
MWFPLESNPDVMNGYIHTLGLKNPLVQFVDVYGLSDELLSMVPTPVHAFLLVYPICEATEKRIAELQDAQQDEVAEIRKAHPFFFTRQLVPNACGTIAILHSLMNNRDKLGEILPGSVLDDAVEKEEVAAADPKVIGALIAGDEKIATAHAAAALEGATENQDIHANINLHFVCFIHAGGRCIELDGRKENPTLHGECDDNAKFVRAAAAAIKERMQLHPDSYEFGITALVDV